ncbi:cytochrome P450 94C1 [Andrographis paniculata]|uniref:cytochrome P450 94C1 n=1 Tax=Andrographis paniculata TaxID=175694 RepID=UPI0021E6F834|nr:cytochrome P450 94C1 [Andrographis paniculata]
MAAISAFATWLIPYSHFIFFTVSLTLILLFVRKFKFQPWCGCHVCQGFLTASWALKYNNLCDWYSHLLAQSPTGTIHVHVLGNVITANPDNVEYILRTNFNNYPKGKPFSAILGDLLGFGIFNVDGDLWKFQRKMACLELGSNSIRSYAYDVVESEIQTRLVPIMSAAAAAGRTVDLQDIFRRFSFDSICKFSFGFDPGCLTPTLPVSEFAAAFDAASKLSAERAVVTSPVVWKVKRFLNVGSEKNLRRAIRSVHELAERVIRNRRDNLAGAGDGATSASNGDLLSRFMSTTADDVFLRDIVVSFLLAGRDTVAAALTSLFWLLSQNPRVTKLIREESDKVIGDGGGRQSENLNFRQLREMHYLQAAVHESMRLFPPVQLDSKFCRSGDVLPDGTPVAGGTRVTYHPYAMGRMAAIWGPDCTEFRPERWIKDGIFRQECPYRYPVFQAGPRVCLGKEMAIVEIKAVALSLIRRFDFEVGSLPSQGGPRFVPGLTATVRGGLPVVVRERED